MKPAASAAAGSRHRERPRAPIRRMSAPMQSRRDVPIVLSPASRPVSREGCAHGKHGDGHGDDDGPREEPPQVLPPLEDEERRTDGQHGHGEERRDLLRRRRQAPRSRPGSRPGSARRPRRPGRRRRGRARTRPVTRRTPQTSASSRPRASVASTGSDLDDRLALEQPDLQVQREQRQRLAQEEGHGREATGIATAIGPAITAAAAATTGHSRAPAAPRRDRGVRVPGQSRRQRPRAHLPPRRRGRTADRCRAGHGRPTGPNRSSRRRR